MRQELIKQAEDLFDRPEKWNAFLELMSQKGDIQNQWYLKLRQEVDKTFLSSALSERWDYKSKESFVYHWFIKELGEDSISLWMENGVFSLHAPPLYNIESIVNHLKSNKFAPITDCFERIDIYFQGGYLFREESNFSFGSPYDSRFNYEKLSWFAGNQTEKFVEQILAKVNRFREGEQITNLIYELNCLPKINSNM